MNNLLIQLKSSLILHKKSVALMLLSVLGLFFTLFLVQNKQYFRSKAFNHNNLIQIFTAGQQLTYNSQRQGYVTSTNQINIKLTDEAKNSLKSVQSFSPIDSSRYLFGISTHAWWIDGNPDEYINHFKSLGTDNIRLAVDWKRFEAVEGRYNFSMYDKVLKRLNNEGFPITGVFVTVPHWASSNPEGCRKDQTKYCDLPANKEGKLRAAIRAMLIRYPFVKRWEVGNEPELWEHLGKNHFDYLRILRAFYEEAKAIDPSVQVAVATLTGWDDYLVQIYKTAPDKPWDAVTFHPYAEISKDGAINPKDVALDDAGTGHRTKQIDRIREGMVQYGDQNKPIWITEYGWDQDPSQQAQKLNLMVKWMSTRPWITEADLHMLHDAVDEGVSQHYGLTQLEPFSSNINQNTRLIPKPHFYDAFKNLSLSANKSSI